MLSCSVRVHFLSIEYVHVQGITYVRLLMSSLIRVSASLLRRKETAIEIYLVKQSMATSYSKDIRCIQVSR